MVSGFVPIILAATAAAGMGGIVLFGLTRIFRQRKITLADLPELPAPPSDRSGGPTVQG